MLVLLALTLFVGAAAQESPMGGIGATGSAGPTDTLAASWTDVSDAFVPGPSGTRIVPEPQEIAERPGAFPITARTTVVLHADTPALRGAAGRLQQDVTLRHGFRPSIASPGEAPVGEPAIRVAIRGRAGEPPLTAEPVTRPEGYVLEVGPSGVTIVGADERGAFYGLQSLRQLLGAAPEIRGVTVRDWPTLPWRVAMVYLDANSDAVNERLLPILAELKYNAVLVMADYVHWDAAPELHVPLGAPRAAAERLAATARANLLEPIPLLETLSHAEWFFANGANAGLQGDPDATRPFVMDPLNPETYRRLLPILDEVVEIFDPRYVHVGHDEVRHVNDFPATPEQRALGFGRLFTDSILRLHDHLAAHGVGTMVWDDELASDEVRPFWDDLPNDLVVTYWRYVAAGGYPTLELLRDAGFRTLGASWFEPANVEAMADAVTDADAGGLIQTRWTGYFGNATMMRGQYRQAYAYVTAAAAAWNPAADHPALAAPARFRDAWLRDQQGGRRAGALVDLSAVTNMPLDAGPFGLDDGYALSALRENGDRVGEADPGDADFAAARFSDARLADVRYGGVRFAVGDVVGLRGTHPRARHLPERVRIPIGRTARSLAFLHATGWYASEGDAVGRYEIVYADGTRAEIPLVYGENIAAWTQTEVDSIDLAQPWQGLTPDGLRVAAYGHRWRNPRPEVPIDRVEFVSDGGIAAPVSFGLTLLDGP